MLAYLAHSRAALYLAQVRGTKWGDEIGHHVQQLAQTPDKVDDVLGMDIIICTTAKTDAEAKALLKLFNMPFNS